MFPSVSQFCLRGCIEDEDSESVEEIPKAIYLHMFVCVCIILHQNSAGWRPGFCVCGFWCFTWQVFSFFNLPPSSEELGDEVVHGPWVTQQCNHDDSNHVAAHRFCSTVIRNNSTGTMPSASS